MISISRSSHCDWVSCDIDDAMMHHAWPFSPTAAAPPGWGMKATFQPELRAVKNLTRLFELSEASLCGTYHAMGHPLCYRLI